MEDDTLRWIREVNMEDVTVESGNTGPVLGEHDADPETRPTVREHIRELDADDKNLFSNEDEYIGLSRSQEDREKEETMLTNSEVSGQKVGEE